MVGGQTLGISHPRRDDWKNSGRVGKADVDPIFRPFLEECCFGRFCEFHIMGYPIPNENFFLNQLFEAKFTFF